MLWLLGIPAVLLVLGVVYQWIWTRRDARCYPPPGQIFDVGGIRLHVRVAGNGSPPVIFEAGIAASSVSWRPVQDAVCEYTTTAAYDRAGFAWSEASKSPMSAPQIAETLHQLLHAAGLEPPYILVGHSFGAFLVRVYASRWPREVKGLVLVDPALTQEWNNPVPDRLRMLGRGVLLSHRGSLLAKIGFVRLSLAMLAGGARALPLLLSKTTSGGGGHSVSSKLVGEVRKLPPALWDVVRAHWCRPESFRSMAWHLEALPATASLVASTVLDPEIPVTVISGGHLTGAQAAEHQAIAQASNRGQHLISKGSGHWVHLDDSELVISAIRHMLAK
jgi:pimeloyl-ACP methyl ester carboxylesterase